jgi:hypothetical protein
MTERSGVILVLLGPIWVFGGFDLGWGTSKTSGKGPIVSLDEKLLFARAAESR